MINDVLVLSHTKLCITVVSQKVMLSDKICNRTKLF